MNRYKTHDMMTISDVNREFGQSRVTIRAAVKAGKVKYFRDECTGHVRFLREHAEAYFRPLPVVVDGVGEIDGVEVCE